MGVRVRIAAGIEYAGTAFSGWQSQPHGRTIQDALEGALAAVADSPVRATCAGRTDSGVHAAAQVVHFDVPMARSEHAWVRGTNSHLPESIAVRWARVVPDEFHARFSARSRSYRYLLYNHPVRPAILHGRVGWFHAPLDAAAMSAAAALLVGEHDFSVFRAAACQAKSPIKRLYCADVTRQGNCVVFELRASAFLHHMVRNIVGALVYVGKGAHPPAWIAELIAGRERAMAAPTFSAAGLYLSDVEYDAHWQLPANGRMIAPCELPSG